MSRYFIRTPVPDFTGVSVGVNFTNGTAEIDVPEGDPQHVLVRALAYFRAQGYGVEPVDEPEPKPTPRSSKTTTPKGADQ